MPEQLNAKEVYDLLKKKGVKHLHHANTVRASLTFVKEKALVSRNYVEVNGLVQTSPVHRPERQKTRAMG